MKLLGFDLSIALTSAVIGVISALLMQDMKSPNNSHKVQIAGGCPEFLPVASCTATVGIEPRSEDGFGITKHPKIALPDLEEDQRRETDFDLIVYGETGCTGRLIAEYLATSYRSDDAPSWAIAGRSTDKLLKARAEIGAPDDLSLVKADAAEPALDVRACGRDHHGGRA